MIVVADITYYNNHIYDGSLVMVVMVVMVMNDDDANGINDIVMVYSNDNGTVVSLLVCVCILNDINS